MDTIQITKENAIKAYNGGCNDVKNALTNLFGAALFVQEKITDKIKGFADILSISGIDSKTFDLRPGETQDELAHRKIKLIAQVYNEGTVLDAGNTGQYKYYPWFEIVKDASKPSGFGLSCHDYVYWSTDTDVGSRLCFKSGALAADAGKKFLDIYEQYLFR